MEEAEVRELVNGQIGPLDGFISAKTRSRFSAVLKLDQVEETKKDKATKEDVTLKKWKTEFDFGDKVDLGTSSPSGPTRRPALNSAKSAPATCSANATATNGSRPSASAA
jgi:hypothetical protein